MEIIRTPEETRRRFARRLTRKIITFVAGIAFLAFVNWQTSPHYWWVLWVIAGWGLGLMLAVLFHLFDCDEDDDYNN